MKLETFCVRVNLEEEKEKAGKKKNEKTNNFSGCRIVLVHDKAKQVSLSDETDFSLTCIGHFYLHNTKTNYTFHSSFASQQNKQIILPTA